MDQELLSSSQNRVRLQWLLFLMVKLGFLALVSINNTDVNKYLGWIISASIAVIILYEFAYRKHGTKLLIISMFVSIFGFIKEFNQEALSAKGDLSATLISLGISFTLTAIYLVLSFRLLNLNSEITTVVEPSHGNGFTENAIVKTQNKVISLAPHSTFKQKAWDISVAMFFLSILLTEVIAFRSGIYTNWLLLLFKNMYLIIPWGVAYVIVARHREFLKMFLPAYLSLTLLVVTISLFFTSQKMWNNFEAEIVKISRYYVDLLANKHRTTQSFPLIYSAKEYGPFAAFLNRCKDFLELSEELNEELEQAINRVEIDMIFSDEVVFNLAKIFEKKRGLEQFSNFLENSYERLEKSYAEHVAWIQSMPGISEQLRKALGDAVAREVEEYRYFREKSYRIMRDSVQTYIKILTFFSQIYGAYDKDEQGQIILANDTDFEVLRAHIETLYRLSEEEEAMSIFLQEKLKTLSSSFRL